MGGNETGSQIIYQCIRAGGFRDRYCPRRRALSLPGKAFVDGTVSAGTGAAAVDDDGRSHGVELLVERGDFLPFGDD